MNIKETTGAYKKLILVVAFISLSINSVIADSLQITGPTTVTVGDTFTYGINQSVRDVWSWTLTLGTSTPNWSAHNTSITWTTAGQTIITAMVQETPSSNPVPVVLSVTVNPSGSQSGSPSTNLSDENYIYTITPQAPFSSITSSTPQADLIESVAYIDGLGRPKQSVEIRAGGANEDMIAHIGYDAYGRQDKEYLPYAQAANGGKYRDDALSGINSFYNTSKYENTTNPYSEKSLEASPLSRILEQGAPGASWIVNKASDADHTIKFDYKTNTGSEVKRYKVTLSFANKTYTPTLVSNGNYPANTLHKSITKDENWTTGTNHTTEEFKDKQGRVVLKRTHNNGDHDTYYIYDDYGNLSYVLPPKVVHDSSISSTELSELCYQYKYDNRSRLVEKKIPGKGWEYIVYDKLDRPILTQDAVQKLLNKWLFTKYDAFGGVAYTGEMTRNIARTTLQGYVTGTASQHVTKQSSATTIDGTTIYYNNGAYPTSYITDIHTINYYDNYTFDKVAGNSESVNGVTPITNVKGLVTGSKVRVLTTNSWITTVTYYDAKSRPIYVYNHNAYLSITDKVKNELDFAGKVDKTTTTHTKGGSDIITIDTFTYDHVGRLISQKQKINNLADEHIVQNNYDALGQLTSKGVGGKTSQGRLQNVDYTYNVRGWTKQINNTASLGNDLFSFKINYNTVNHGGTALFNGNISETEWKTKNSDQGLKWYKYSYDALNRITVATANSSNYNLGSTSNPVTYDKNGNITSLIRRGHTNSVATSFGEMDNLIYTYETNSNRLKKVLDNGNDTYGFKDGANQTTEYTYDANANLITDANKNITSISYNHLNLPVEVKFSNSNTKKVNYTYDASGAKLKKVTNSNGSITTTDYASGYVYENNNLQFFNHSEGYVDVAGGYKYVYQFKDYLGNIRLSYMDDDNSGSVDTSEIIKESNYYPYGLKMLGLNGNVSAHGNSVAKRYMFGGKEYQDENIGGNYLNWYDVTARNYDPALGRWMNIDPLAEDMRRHSPYNYAFNNPMRFIDPDGMAPSDIILRGANNSSITVVTDLVDLDINASSLGIDFGGTYSFDGDDILVAALDVAGIFDPTGAADIAAGSIEMKNGNFWSGIASYAGVAPLIGDVAKLGKIPKHLKTINKAIDAVHGNSKLSKKVQHGYQMFDKKTGEVLEYGISGQKRSAKQIKNGGSPRINQKKKQKYNDDPNVGGRVIEENIPNRKKGLDWEQKKVDDNPVDLPNQKRPKRSK